MVTRHYFKQVNCPLLNRLLQINEQLAPVFIGLQPYFIDKNRYNKTFKPTLHRPGEGVGSQHAPRQLLPQRRHCD